MSEASALLPQGFRDRLPPGAEAAAALLRSVVDTLASHGYARVQPPLVEHEASLARWLGKPLGTALFRSPDPMSGAALALRPDITGQIARIAATRLAAAPRPLRLAYGGPVLRARGTQLAPARELTQAGAELIGTDSVAALAEMIAVSVEALERAGVTAICVDLTLPELVPALAAGPWPVADPQAVVAALDGKDSGALEALGAIAYCPLLEAAGPVSASLARLQALPIDAALLASLAALIAKLPAVAVTLDPTERHGFEYHSWIGFSLFGEANGTPVRGEIGRGGSYRVRHPDGTDEPACGFSLYIDSLVDAGLGESPARRIFIPEGTAAPTAAALRAEGFATVAALSPADTAAGCSHIWNGSAAVAKDP